MIEDRTVEPPPPNAAQRINPQPLVDAGVDRPAEIPPAAPAGSIRGEFDAPVSTFESSFTAGPPSEPQAADIGRHPADRSSAVESAAADTAAPGAAAAAGGATAAAAPERREAADTASLSHIRLGAGKPLVLLHGLGGSWRSWMPVIPTLAAERDVIAVDLPGFGETPPLPDRPTLARLADAVSAFLDEQGLQGADVVGSSMGARLVLELARRGVVGAAIALNPGGFWTGWQRGFFAVSIRASIALVRALAPVMPFLTGNPLTRSLLFAQLSVRPWDIAPDVALAEMRSFAAARSFDEMLDDLVNGPPQLGSAEAGRGPLVIVWGRQDRVCFPSQAARAHLLFPHARLVWFDGCGHFPQWDLPQRTARLILTTTD